MKIFCEESCKATLLKGTLPAPRRNVRSTPDGGSAVQPPGLSYTAHWEALGCALCLLTTPEISSTGPVRGRGFCPGSHRPRARVPLVVWAWDFLLCGFLAAVSRPLLAHCFSPCDLRLFVIKRISFLWSPVRTKLSAAFFLLGPWRGRWREKHPFADKQSQIAEQKQWRAGRGNIFTRLPYHFPCQLSTRRVSRSLPWRAGGRSQGRARPASAQIDCARAHSRDTMLTCPRVGAPCRARARIL